MEHILSLSYGKDSLACLGAIEQLGWPLDRIVHAEVWATDTIPADLPPMVEFKEKADKIIKERWKIDVEHTRAKRTYEERFYTIRTEKAKKRPGMIYGWPFSVTGAWCNSDVKMPPLKAVEKGGIIAKSAISHWMPLPESPKISKDLNRMEWISVKKIKPECEEEVLVRVKHEYPNGKLYYITTTAIYEDGKMNTDDSIWYWDDYVDFDYDEENDEYLIPEGWWEYRHYNPDDVYNNMIDGEVTHWMKLPDLREGD